MKKGHEIKVLDHGFVRYVDHMGTDKSIVEAARVSYASGSKGDKQDKKLLEYLYKNKHCYHPSMQVLTSEGWKNWSDCKKKEKFLIPNPEDHSLTIEELDVLSFDCNEDLFCFKNNRMSYMVTSEHRMYFKDKYSDEFSIQRVNKMSQWGHFKPLNKIRINIDDLPVSHELQYVGFFLGDGSPASINTITFHLDKKRKIEYLKQLCFSLDLDFKERKSSSHKSAVLITVYNSQCILNKYINRYKKAKDKSFDYPLDKLKHSELMGLYTGLLNSDGSLKQDRPQSQFSSSSYSLINLFDTLGAYLGYPTHKISTGACSFNGRTSLESRKQYHFKKKHTGLVYCATSSTGLLCVRGKDTEFGFVCGNTSPFEMVKVKFNIKLPIFVMRQFVRHRMQNLNEVSARYTELPDEFYIPETWRKQDTKNKQGSVVEKNWNPDFIYDATDWEKETTDSWWETDATKLLKETCDKCYAVYKAMLEAGIAREMARMVLPVNIYTECYSCWDLKNLLHFITLREDSHAQAEIQEYAKAMKDILRELFPWTIEIFDRYKVEIKQQDG